MNEPRTNLNVYLASLRKAEPIDFDRARRVVSAAAILERASIIESIRLDVLIWSKRSLDLLITPLLGLLLVALLPSATIVPRSTMANLVAYDRTSTTAPVRSAMHAQSQPFGFDHRGAARGEQSAETRASQPIEAFASIEASAEEAARDRSANKEIDSNRSEGGLQAISEVPLSYPLSSAISPPVIPHELKTGAFASPMGFSVHVSTSVAGTIHIPSTGSHAVHETALEGELALSGEHAIGFVVGVQSYSERVISQRLVQTGDPLTGATLTRSEWIESIQGARNIWYGFNYSWTPMSARVLNFQPVLQVAAGMSSLGAMLRTAIGLQWHPADGIAIGASATNALFTGSSNAAGPIRATCITISGGVNW